MNRNQNNIGFDIVIIYYGCCTIRERLLTQVEGEEGNGSSSNGYGTKRKGGKSSNFNFYYFPNVHVHIFSYILKYNFVTASKNLNLLSLGSERS